MLESFSVTVFVMLSHFSLASSFMDVHFSDAFSFISLILLITFSFSCPAFSLMVSQFLYRRTPAATTPATTPMIGNSPDDMSNPVALVIVPIADINVPITIRIGPIAAATAPMITIILFCSSLNPLNLSVHS